ncbi:hypothetical protein JL722_14525 [Aureococcus anophagefferens]|nr:hypothetical protein JL722_14525 [Aureococcus anophagefferens]
MTFADGDGSLGAAGVLFPRRGDGAGNSVVLSLAGVGVSAQAQADAYKRKVDEADADYTFGFEDLWVLCPDRAGPHNWEDLGLRTAERAVRVLAADRGADATNIVVHGHSRGGHGAWGFAVRFPDLGAVGDNDNALFLANLRGAKALVRVASGSHREPVVRPQGRALSASRGAGVELDSVDADHWWWDTARPNDGGAVHDDAARAFTLAAAAARRTTLADVLAKGPVTVVAGSPQTYGGRFGLRVVDRPDPGARAFATFKSNASLETRNARRLALAGEALAALPLTIGGDIAPGPAATPWISLGRRAARDYSGAELALATYVASNHYVWARTSTRVVSLADAAPLRNSHRFLYLGLRAQDRFRTRTAGPCARRRRCASGTALSTPRTGPAPRSSRRRRRAASTSSSPRAARKRSRGAATTFASNQPHTRAPFSNMLPDFVLVDEDARWTGVGGVRAAGYFDDAWGVASGFFSC